MAIEPAAKRRKIVPSPEEAEENGSFASFGSEADDGEVEEHENGVSEDEEMEDGDVDQEDAEEDSESEDDEDTPVVAAAQPVPSKAAPTKAQLGRKPNGAINGTTTAFTGEVYKSNMFKLQVDDLLKSVRPKYTAKDKAIGQALRTLKEIIESIPSRGPASVLEAETVLRKKDNVIVPFPEPRPPKDANYKLQYAKPSYINAVGSLPLGLGTKLGDEIVVDLVVTMPDEIFQEKDFLNHRYFYKRAHYLACLAAGIKANKDQKYQLSFEKMHGNQLSPVLVVEISRENQPGLPAKVLKIVITPGVAESFFPKDKLAPGKNCVRKGSSDTQDQVPTPFYNASLRADGLITSHLTLQHQATKQCEAYRDACILGRIFLRQRGFHSRVSSGGFGNFEWATLIALLLKSGGSKGKPAFSSGYSSYQLFKAMLQYLASRDLLKLPQVIGDSSTKPVSPKGVPILWDVERGMNVLFKMTAWSWKALQYEAKAAVAMLGDSTFEHFDEAFILRSDRPSLRYDMVVEVPITTLSKDQVLTDAVLRDRYSAVYQSLVEGPGDRVKLVSLTPPQERPWTISSKASVSKKGILRIGFILDPANAHRLIDHGPPAEETAASAKFREFWGSKAELRRFRDGSILETVIWPATDDSAHSVFRRVLTFILEEHVSEAAAKSMVYRGDADASLLPSLSSGSKAATTAPFQSIMDAFRQFETDLRALDDLPLAIRVLLASDPYFSYSSIEIPHTPHKLMTRPAELVMQFEGSARWPDDLDAIQRTKMAFLLKIAELLESSKSYIRARVGLENGENPLLNQSFLDVHYMGDMSSKMYGVAFRIRIHHDRELTLLERQLKDKSLALSQAERQDVASAIAHHKRVFIKEPAHTQALQTLATRFPAFSGTVRLLAHWISSHNLQNHITPQVISMFAARAFTNPYPWNSASSPQAGFLRSLLFLSRWDWRTQPWIADLGSTMTKDEVASIRTRFEAWRKIDPAMNRVVLFAASNVDSEGTTWMDHGRPAKVVAGRLVGLAKAAIEHISEQGAHLEPEALFESSLADYDFVIHLDPKVLGKTPKKSSKPAYKNLELQQANSGGVDDFTLASGNVGFAPATLFLEDLERILGQAVVFFAHDDVIAGLWNPTCEERAWKLSLGYSSVPTNAKGEKEAHQAQLNKGGILAEIARLGEDMVVRIEIVAK